MNKDWKSHIKITKMWEDKDTVDPYLDTFLIIDPADHPHTHLSNLTECRLLQTDVSEDLDHPFSYADTSVLYRKQQLNPFELFNVLKALAKAKGLFFIWMGCNNSFCQKVAVWDHNEEWTSHEPSTFPWQQAQQFQWDHFSLAEYKE